MKRNVALFILFCTLCSFVAPFLGQSIALTESINVTENEDNIIIASNPDELRLLYDYHIDDAKRFERIIKKNEFIKTVESLALSIDDKEQFYTEYKELASEYKDYISFKTIQDEYIDSELYMLYSIVEAEVTGEGNFIEKANVCSVILNRVKDETGGFPDTITGVVTQSSQFSTYSNKRYKRIEISITTLMACDYVYQFGDTTDGALWFDSTKGNSWADRNKEFLFCDNVGHNFYK